MYTGAFQFVLATFLTSGATLVTVGQYPAEVDKPKAMLWIAVLARFYWLAGSVFGAAMGSVLPVALDGIDFCLTALFITIVIDQWKAAQLHLPVLAGFGCGIVLLAALGADRFILPALLLTSAILLLYALRREKAEVQP